MYTVSSCLIVKDEVSNIVGLVSDLSKFSDQIVIVDTGSTDGTLEYLQSNKNVDLYRFEWVNDFSKARNFSFSKATSDYVFWCDADDRLSEKLLDYLNQIKVNGVPNGFDSIKINYRYEGTLEGVNVPRVRLLSRNLNPMWYSPIHEYVTYPNINSYYENNIDTCVIHNHNKSRSNRNLLIFESMISLGTEFSARDKYYYANELMDNRYFDKALSIFKNLVSNDEGWSVDLLNASIKIHNINACLGKELSESINYLLHALKYGNPRADLYCLIGDWFLSHRNYSIAEDWYMHAIKLGEPKGDLSLLYTIKYHTWYPYLQLSVVYWNLDRKIESRDANEIAFKYNNDNRTILNNREFFNSLNL